MLSGDTLYGTTVEGGTANDGTVFKVNTDGSGFAVLKHFTGADGLNPQASLTLCGAALCGTTHGGGFGGYGTVFQVNPDGSDFCVLKSFTGSDGSGPCGRLAWSNGALYGTTAVGGDANNGVIFALYFSTTPTILTNPASQAATAGSTVDLVAGAAGLPPLAYQWFFDGTNALSGATSPSLHLENVQLSQAGFYAVVVTNAFGAVTSAPAMLSVTPSPPVILTAPSSQAVAVGDTVVLTISSAGSLPLGYQWLFNASPIPGAGNTSLELSNVQISQSGSYTVIITNAFGSVTSPPAVLTVIGSPPVVLTPPSSQEASLGQTVTFTASATGSPPLTYQWWFNGSPVPGAGTTWLQLTDVQLTQAGSYCLVITNAFGAVTSPPAELTVTALPPVILTPPSSQIAWLDQSVAFTVSALGSPPLSYQWCLDGSPLAGAGSSLLQLNHLQLSQSGFYSVIITNAFGAVTSAPALLEVNVKPGIPTQFQYTVNTNGTITITGYNGPGGAVTIPSTINGLPVTSIGDIAFDAYHTANQFDSPLTSVTIPDSVTSIGDLAFQECTSLANISIPNSVTNIGEGAFRDCYSLTYVGIPNRLTSIGTTTFTWCTSLVGVTIPDSVTSIGGGAFWACGALASVTIGNNVTNIGDSAFEYCDNLTNAYFEGNAPSLGDSDVFTGDSHATVYYLPGTTGWASTFGGRPTAPWSPELFWTYTTNSGAITITGYTGPSGEVAIPSTINGLPVTSIGNYAFYNGAAPLPYILTSLTIPNSVTSIGSYAFAGCGSLRNVALGDGVATIGAGAFADCGLSTLTIPRSATSIGDSAFAFCPLTATFFQGDAPVLGGSSVFAGEDNVVYYLPGTHGWGPAFGGCPTGVWDPPPFWLYTTTHGTITITAYTGPEGAVVIPSTINGLPVTSIGVAFQDCSSVTSVVIPNNVTSIGGQAFYECRNLASVSIPNSVTRIGIQAFSGCYSLTNVTIPDGVTSIGDSAFSGCGSLASVTIGDSVTNIGAYAFSGCSSLTRVTIPDSVTSIGSWAFANCCRLTGVMIGHGVTSIQDFAFGSCPDLTDVWFQGNSPAITSGSSLFYSANQVTVYYSAGTTGWGTTYGGRPTALATSPITQTPPQTQTAEASSTVNLGVEASGPLLWCWWYFNDTNLISCGPSRGLELTNVDFSQAGTYAVVVSNALGAATSGPAMLNVIAPVERRPVPSVKVTGESGSLFNLDYASSLGSAPVWTSLGSVSLTSASQYYFDLTLPLPPQRFYRAWQTGTPGMLPSLDLHWVPAITLTGNIGGSVRLDAINQFGPIDAWFTLDTVTLTNTSQLYFDVSAWRQPPRLYRLVQVP